MRTDSNRSHSPATASLKLEPRDTAGKMLRNDYSWTDVALTVGATLLLAAMAVTSLALRFITSPIACWLPSQFTADHGNYVHEMCFRQTHFYEPMTSAIPMDNPGGAMRNVITYHQWVPLALGVGALLCLLPHVAWRMLSGPLLLDTHALLSSVRENQRQAAERRDMLLRDTAILLQSALKRGNSWLTMAVLCRKLLACLTCLVQLVLVVVLFRPQLGHGDMEAWGRIRDSDTYPLPTVPILCGVSVRLLDTVHRYDLQCVLTLNQVYSLEFTFLFCVFSLLAGLCTVDLLLWAARVMVPGLRDVAVHRHLDAAVCGGDSLAVSQLYPRFAQWLGWDGRLLLALTADHCGPRAAADLTHHLWVVFKGAPRPAGPQAPPPGTVGATFDGGEPCCSAPLMPTDTEAETKAL